jgi:hypothetical protein
LPEDVNERVNFFSPHTIIQSASLDHRVNQPDRCGSFFSVFAS